VADGAARVVVLYDGECGFCAWGVAWLLRWDRQHSLRPVAIQSAEGALLLADVPEQRRLASWHVRDPRGQLSSGGAALAPALARLPAGGPLAALAARFPRAAEAGYGLLAAHRAALGRAIPAAAKRRARALIALRMH
jgi:predicted DCC family thiol-disulfide oxidoreductase YuxK